MRKFLFVVPLLILTLPAVSAQESRQATGVKVGEVTDASAIVWMRVTAKAARNPEQKPPAEGEPDKLDGAVPGAVGTVQLRYGTKADLSDAKATDAVAVKAENDFSHQFRLTGLKPGSVYHYSAETAGPQGMPKHAPLKGSFTTAPPATERAEVRFTVITGQAYKDLDRADGFHIYEAMGKLKPHFLVPTGDTVYYDNDPPLVTTTALARYHWQRMYGLPRHVAFHLNVPGYWEKDDHDTLDNDCWPAREAKKMLPMTFPEGQRIFREQTPVGEKLYRTFRWGKALQIWLVEGRDFRSPNTMKDGPGKTIWGAEQKKWLFESIKASDADWRVLVSPTPIVGPDRGNKGDNHANVAFAHEGDEFRQWVKQNVPDNFFVACGDRHWQYYSVHPQTGVKEFSCGPASDQHSGGSPGENKDFHRFHRVKGGFLSVTAGPDGNRSRIVFRFHDVQGGVVHEYQQTR